MLKYKKGLILGFALGVVFAAAHLYLNIRYDLPFWLILFLMGKIVSCAGRGCWAYVVSAGILSAVIWAFVGAAIQKYALNEQEDLADE